MMDRIFDRETVFIVAGGPSLIGFDFDRLRNLNTIAINLSYTTMPHASLLWWSDATFFRRHRAALLDHPATWKATCTQDYFSREVPWPPIHQYKFTGLSGFDPDPRYLRTGNNSAYAAMHLAVHLGATRLVLLGVDMQYGPNRESHWVPGGHGLTHSEGILHDLMLPHFASLREPLEQRGVEVLNANPESALRVWPRVTLDSILGGHDAGSDPSMVARFRSYGRGHGDVRGSPARRSTGR
jgi:hypothetical protein